jgi:hypothetical protein
MSRRQSRDESHGVRKLQKFFINSSSFHRNEITTSLTYEELLPFIIDPSWIRLRKICFTSCWIVFFVILLAACISSHQSMSKMSCNITTRSDNVPFNTAAAGMEENAQGILSIVLNNMNSTVVT